MWARVQARLAWVMTAALLVTVPVTGGGRCPCRFVHAFRAPTPAPANPIPAPAPSPGCTCCRHDTDRDAPTRFGDVPLKSSPSNSPADAPCDHRLVVDAAVGSLGERPETTDGNGNTNTLVCETHAHPRRVSNSLTGATELSPLQCPGTHLIRYAHAFRS